MINTWATRWNISPQALNELRLLLGAASQPASGGNGQSEAVVQNAVRIEHARLRHGRLWRNNSGVATGENGVPVRYGLCNDTPKINKVVKSSDLIGITPTACPCGRWYGVFTAYEAKRPGWSFRQSDERAVAQLAFGTLVTALGGIFKFVQSPEDI